MQLAAVCARSGASATSVADRHDIGVVSTDWRELVESDELDALVVATPHAEHAAIAAAGLRAGKAVFVEKPLAIDREGLAEVAAAAEESGGLLLVGHNRRFAPLARKLKEAVAGPLLIQIRVAAGPLAPGHWLDDPEQGGRVLGEISHFVDLATFLAGGPPVEASRPRPSPGSLLGDAALRGRLGGVDRVRRRRVAAGCRRSGSRPSARRRRASSTTSCGSSSSAPRAARRRAGGTRATPRSCARSSTQHSAGRSRPCRSRSSSRSRRLL